MSKWILMPDSFKGTMSSLEICRLMREALALLESDLPVEEGDVTIQFHVGKGYGIAGPEDTEAVKLVAQSEGIFFDPVYTGKAFCHFLHLLEEGYFDGEENILFLHSGGAGCLKGKLYRLGAHLPHRQTPSREKPPGPQQGLGQPQPSPGLQEIDRLPSPIVAYPPAEKAASFFFHHKSALFLSPIV